MTLRHAEEEVEDEDNDDEEDDEVVASAATTATDAEPGWRSEVTGILEYELLFFRMPTTGFDGKGALGVTTLAGTTLPVTAAAGTA